MGRIAHRLSTFDDMDYSRGMAMNASYAHHAEPSEKNARSADSGQPCWNPRHDTSSPQRKAAGGIARVALRTFVLMLTALAAVLAPMGTLAAKTKPPRPPPSSPKVTCARKGCIPPPAPSPSHPMPPPPRAPGAAPPNFVVVVTDDQDDVLNSTHPAYMPALNALLAARGTRFANTLSSTSVCCPARVSLLTGRYAHCSNVTSNWAPAGAWFKFSRLGLDSDWLPGWLQAAGYHTILLGKFLNGFSVPLAAKQRCPLGLNILDALTNGTYNFFDSYFSYNCGPSKPTGGAYQTDVIRDRALSYLDDAIDTGRPFYLHITPAAPHVDNGAKGGWRPPPPAPRHAGLYPDLQLPANPTFRKANLLNPSRRLDMSIPENVKRMADLYAGRIRALRAVDEMIADIVSKLESRGALNNTYIIFASDNGLHMGQHSLADGKATPLEEDSRVPLYIAGPGIPAGVVSAYQANLLDVPITVRTLAGLPFRSDLDGLPLPLGEPRTEAAYGTAMRMAAATAAARQPRLRVAATAESTPRSPAPPVAKAVKSAKITVAAVDLPPTLVPPSSPSLPLSPSAPPGPPSPPSAPSQTWFREGMILEAWDSDAKSGFFPGITFKALRLCSNYTLILNSSGAATAATTTSSRPPALMVPSLTNGSPLGSSLTCLKYIVWCKDSQRELYDLSMDPYESTNVLPYAPAVLLSRLDALLSVLVHCRGVDCSNPWGVMHPDGDVLNFAQAMHPRHDALYASLPRFTYATCYPLYVPANERAFTLGLGGFPANVSWASTGIVWPLPGGGRGLSSPDSDED